MRQRQARRSYEFFAGPTLNFGGNASRRKALIGLMSILASRDVVARRLRPMSKGNLDESLLVGMSGVGCLAREVWWDDGMEDSEHGGVG